MALERKVKVVLDADVIIHFAKGGRLADLPRILPEYEFVLLDVVKRDLSTMILLLLNQLIIHSNVLGSSNLKDVQDRLPDVDFNTYVCTKL